MLQSVPLRSATNL